jgi:hypothetical protein
MISLPYAAVWCMVAAAFFAGLVLGIAAALWTRHAEQKKSEGPCTVTFDIKSDAAAFEASMRRADKALRRFQERKQRDT